MKEEVERLREEYNKKNEIKNSKSRIFEELSHQDQELTEFARNLESSYQLLMQEKDEMNRKVDSLLSENQKLIRESHNIITQMLKVKEESMSRQDEILSIMDQLKIRSQSVDESVNDYEILDEPECESFQYKSHSFKISLPHKNLITFTAHEVEGILLAYNNGGSMVLSSGGERRIKVWDHLSGFERKSFSGYNQSIISLSLSDSNDLVLGGCSSGAGYLWNFLSSKLKHKLNGHGLKINGTAFTKFGSQAVTGSEDLTLRFWDVNTGYCVRNSNMSSVLYSMTNNSSDSSILTGHKDGSFHLWLQNSSKSTKLFSESSSVTSCEFSSCGNYVSGQLRNNKLVVFDMRMMEALHRFSHKELKCPGIKSGISFSPSSRFISCGSFNGKIFTWSLTGNDFGVIYCSDKPVVSVKWNPEESQVSAIDISGAISVWE